MASPRRLLHPIRPNPTTRPSLQSPPRLGRLARSGLRALARTLLDRIEHVGTGATTRAARRAQRRARRSAFYAAEDARHEHGRYQEADHSGDGARFWAYNDG